MKRLTLIEALQEVPEHRRAQGTRYRMVPMLTFIVCAMLAGRRGIRPTLEWGRDVGDRFEAGNVAKLRFGTGAESDGASGGARRESA